jgi:hypothetical protein
VNTNDYQMPPRPLETYAVLPPEQYIPEGVKPIVDKLHSLRIKVVDNMEAVAVARQRITEVESAQIKATVDKLAAGETDASVNSTPVDKAKRDAEAALRNLRASYEAVRLVEIELGAAYEAHKVEALSLADDAVETIRGEYRKAVEQLAKVRRDFHDAADAARFARLATATVSDKARMSMIGYNGQRVADSAAELARFRAEIDPPMMPESVLTPEGEARNTGRMIPSGD